MMSNEKHSKTLSTHLRSKSRMKAKSDRRTQLTTKTTPRVTYQLRSRVRANQPLQRPRRRPVVTPDEYRTLCVRYRSLLSKSEGDHRYHAPPLVLQKGKPVDCRVFLKRFVEIEDWIRHVANIEKVKHRCLIHYLLFTKIYTY